MTQGIVYVLVNEAFDGYVKIGRTINLEQRLKQLDNTSVPLPFRCVFAIEVPDMDKIEKLAHSAFADHRVRTNREFFEIDQQRVISALQMTGGKEVTPKSDIAADEDGLKALENRKPKRRVWTLFDAELKPGDVLTFTRDEDVTATVIDERKIEFRGDTTSVSGAALTLLHELGYTWKTVNGWGYWLYDGETIGERLNRLLEEREGEE
ncbi:GIY-YIG nuclease family protein [Paracoccaceae bacterium]|nr:GIY-YIG nuclease family protein [Paracoccaceae bacterium]